MLDVLIRGGRIIDGTGTPWFRGDVAVQDGRVVGVGVVSAESARRVLDVDDLFVCPGFVDMHAHSDLQLLAQPTWEIKLAQGVTLDVLGQDGLGLAPITEEAGATLRQQLRGWNGDPQNIAFDWRSVAEYLARFDGHVATNVALLAPHGTIRLDVMGTVNRAPTAGELRAMQDLLDGAMRDGAVGLSAGLTYAPAMYADDDELVALCEVIRPYGGYYGPHHRSYGATAFEAYQASIDIARRARVPLHLTHALMNYPVNRGRAPELLRLVDEARAEGIEVTLDSYPYLAGNTYLHAYLPSWVHEGGNAAILRRLDDPDTRARIRHEMEEVGSDGFQGVSVDWSTIVIASVSRPDHRHLVGLSIPDAAAREGAANAFDFFCDLLLADDLGVGSLAFSGNEDNVRTVMQHPAHMAGQRRHRDWRPPASAGVGHVRTLPGVLLARARADPVRGHGAQDEQLAGGAARLLRPRGRAAGGVGGPGGVRRRARPRYRDLRAAALGAGGDSVRAGQRPARDRQRRAHRRPARASASTG